MVTWWTLQVTSLFDWAIVIILSIPVCLFAGWLGRKSQYRTWDWNTPYDERVKNLRLNK